MRRLLALAVVLPTALLAQTGTRVPSVRAIGEATVSVRPDQARIGVAIVTQGRTANEVAADNATRTQAVFDKLRSVLGSNAELRSTNYSLTPTYNFPRDNSTPTLSGFSASNSIEVTITDLRLVGQVIDTGVAAGATRVDGVRMMLRDDEPVRNQALRSAGQKARARAEAIAAGLGAKLGAVLAAEEGVNMRPQPMLMEARAAAAQTPFEPGNLEVQAVITVEFQLVQ